MCIFHPNFVTSLWLSQSEQRSVSSKFHDTRLNIPRKQSPNRWLQERLHQLEHVWVCKGKLLIDGTHTDWNWTPPMKQSKDYIIWSNSSLHTVDIHNHCISIETNIVLVSCFFMLCWKVITWDCSMFTVPSPGCSEVHGERKLENGEFMGMWWMLDHLHGTQPAIGTIQAVCDV